MRTRAIVFIACALVSWCAAARPAGAADAPQQPVQSPVDTAAQVPDSVATAVDRLVPANGTYMKANENDMSLGNISRLSFDAGSGWTLLSALSAERRHYRTQKMTDVMESFITQASKVAPELYVFNVSVGQNYSKKKTLGLGRYGKDIVFDNQSANAVLSLVSPRLGAKSSNLTFMAEGRRGTNDFKFDRTVGGSVSGGLAYAAGDALSASGGFGTTRRVESSEIGGRTFSRMPSTADTIRAGLSYGTGDKKILQVSYLRSNGIERQIMPPLGNSLEILDDPSKATQEEARGKLRQLSVGSALAPFSFLSMDIQFFHKLESQTYLVDSRRSGESENTSIEANGFYRYAKAGGLRFGVTRSERVSDYGPKSLSSMTIREYALRGGLVQAFSDSTIELSAMGSGRLQQNFYKQRDANPRDGDMLSYSGEGTIKAKILPRVSANITGAASRYETIYINATLSGDNRVDYQYRLGPTIYLKPLGWLSITQDYTVKIEFTDFVFTENKNYLNRSTTLNTRAEMTPTKRTAFFFRHSYLMRDTGSYLRKNGRELYSPNSRNIENSLAFDMRYTLSPEFLIKAQADFRTQESGIYGLIGTRRGIVRTTIYESGGFKVGFARKKEIWNAGSVDLDVAYARNYGTFITEARREFWEVNSAVNLKF